MVLDEISTDVLVKQLDVLHGYQNRIDDHKKEIKDLNKTVKEVKKEISESLSISPKVLDKALKDFEFAILNPDMELQASIIMTALMERETREKSIKEM